MVVATVFFWLGRKKFVHIPAGGPNFFRQFFSREGLGALGRIITVYVFIAVFWALWDQSSGGSWTLQCKKMDLSFAGLKLLPAQVQTANPILILLLYPAGELRHLSGLGTADGSDAAAQDRGGPGTHGGQLSGDRPYPRRSSTQAAGPRSGGSSWPTSILTLGEAMVSITGLEFSYTQAPNKMKSAIMAAWLFTVSHGRPLHRAA